nr:hypothetical protein [Streptoalloteichus hindustanus]
MVEQPREPGVLAGRGDVPQVGVLPSTGGGPAGDLVLGEDRGDRGQHRERLQLRRLRRGVVREDVEDVFEQRHAVRPEGRPGDDQGGQPRVPQHDQPGLVADRDEVGDPVAVARAEVVLRARRVDHQVEQVVAGGDVAVEPSSSHTPFANEEAR